MCLGTYAERVEQNKKQREKNMYQASKNNENSKIAFEKKKKKITTKHTQFPMVSLTNRMCVCDALPLKSGQRDGQKA